MNKRKQVRNILVIFICFQISFGSCLGQGPNNGVSNVESNSGKKPRNEAASFRVLEEPKLESLAFSNRNFNQRIQENYQQSGPDFTDSELKNRELAGDNAKNYNRINPSPKFNRDALPLPDNEARFALQNRNRRKWPRPAGDDGPSRRQGVTEAPKLDITSVSPIQSSLGGLTGLQGLPPLSLIQFVKLLVAVTPFIIPLVFVPLLIFTIGMFMIPVNKTSYFIGGDAGIRSADALSEPGISWTSWGANSVVPLIKSFGKKIANHEECIERLACEMGRKYLPEEGSNGKSSIMNRNVVQRILNYFDHPLMRRISRSLQTFPDPCSSRTCGPASFLEKYLYGPTISDTN